MLLKLQMGQYEGQTVQLWNVSGMKKKLLSAFEKRGCVKMSIFFLNKTDVFCFNSLCFLFLFTERAGDPAPRKNQQKGSNVCYTSLHGKFLMHLQLYHPF